MSEIPKNKTPGPSAPYVQHPTKDENQEKESRLTSDPSTPQNTPANNAPISSHAQQPGVGTIKEGTLITFVPHRVLGPTANTIFRGV